MKTYLKKNWVSIVVMLGIAAILFTIIRFMYIRPFNDGSGNADSSVFADYGDFVAGLMGTLIGSVTIGLVYLTFIKQQSFFHKERFENRLFEMIRSNRDMIWNMEYEMPDEYTENKDNKTKHANKHNALVVRGQKVFVQIHKQIRSACEECSWVFSKYKLAENVFISTNMLEQEKQLMEKYYGFSVSEKFLFEIQQYSVVYTCIFFGMGEGGLENVNTELGSKYKLEFVKDIILTLKLKPAKWSIYYDDYCRIKKRKFSTLQKVPKYYNKKYDKFYGGHHHRRGQYFRHLFTIYNYVNEQSFLNYEQKYKYSRMLRSQFSAYEQSVFFYNSIFRLGRDWELTAIKSGSWPIEDFQLITKYNVIKNISKDFTGGPLELHEIYPLIEFEGKEKVLKKIALKRNYH